MARDTQLCSDCGAAMEYRLGQFECPGCGRTQLAARAEDEDRGRRLAGPAASGGGSYDPGAQYRSAPPASGELPPPPRLAGGYGQPGGYPASPGGGGNDTLHTEKMIYLGLQALGMIVMIFALALTGSLIGQNGGPGGAAMPNFGASLVVGGIIGALIGLGVLWLTLFGRELWLKWTCLGCSGLGALLTAGNLLAGGAVSSFAGEGYSALTSFFQVAINIWFLSILWRDIKQLNSGY